MERIKFSSNDLSLSKIKNKGININEIKSFLSEVDNYSFDQIKLKLKPNLNKIVIDCATGIRYPAYDDFVTKIQESKYANYFDLK